MLINEIIGCCGQERDVATETLMTLASTTDKKSWSAQRRWWATWTGAAAAALLLWRHHRSITATITITRRRPCRWPPPVYTATYVSFTLFQTDLNRFNYHFQMNLNWIEFFEIYHYNYYLKINLLSRFLLFLIIIMWLW